MGMASVSHMKLFPGQVMMMRTVEGRKNPLQKKRRFDCRGESGCRSWVGPAASGSGTLRIRAKVSLLV